MLFSLAELPQGVQNGALRAGGQHGGSDARNAQRDACDTGVGIR